MIRIVEVKTKKEQKRFIDFPLELYRGNAYFVPPLYSDEKKLFSKNFVYREQCECVYFNAYDNDKLVGRISGILQKASNLKHGEKRVRFTRFDCIDSEEVAKALFSALENWAASRGMDEVVGPLGFSDLEREGLLIEGFDELSTFEEQYNYPYYQRLIEGCGYGKEVDWVESQLRLPQEGTERIFSLCERVLKHYKLHFGTAKNTNDFLKKYSDAFFEILDKTYEDIYGTVPFTDGMKKMMISNFRLILNLNYVAVLLNEKEEVVCFGLCFPSLSKAIRPSGGKLTPATVFRVLKSVKKPETIDLGLVGVLPEYRGAAVVIVAETMKMLQNGIQYAETNLNLENNNAILNLWKSFDVRSHKRRRCFVKKI